MHECHDDPHSEATEVDELPKAPWGWRLHIGVALIAFALIAPLFALLLVPLLPLPAVAKVTLGGLFVAGGQFWDKLKSLFVHGAYAVFPEKANRQ